MKRIMLVGMALMLAACGPSAARLTAATPIVTPPAATPAAIAAIPTPSSSAPGPSPTVVALSVVPAPAQAVPAPPRVAAAVPPSPPPPVMGRSFSLLPVGGSGAFGDVTVFQQSGFLSATVVVHGVANGTLHTVHIHLGGCGNPYGGMHLTVLGLLAGDASNSGGFTAAIAPVYVSSGHYVIVYSTSSPIRIIACANL